MDVYNDHGPYDNVDEAQAAALADLDGPLDDLAVHDPAVDDPAVHDGEGYDYPVFENGLPNGYLTDESGNES